MEPSVRVPPVMWVKTACQKSPGPRHSRLAKSPASEALTRPHGIRSKHAYQAYMVQNARGRMRFVSHPRPRTLSEAPKHWLQSARPSWSKTTCCRRAHDHRCEADDESMRQTRLHESLIEHNDDSPSEMRSVTPSASGSRHLSGGHCSEERSELPHAAFTAPLAPYAVPWSMLGSQALEMLSVDASKGAAHGSSPT